MRQACSYVGRGLELGDLIQEGFIGLMTALDRFRLEEGTVFRNYAAFWVRQAVLRAVANKSRLIRLPVHVQDKFGDAEPGAVQEHVGTAKSDAQRLDSSLESSGSPEVRFVPLGKVSETELYQAMSAANVNSGTSSSPTIDVAQVAEDLDLLLTSLDARERAIITRRFGLNGIRSETLDQIGIDYGLTRERIRQIEEKILKKFRHPSRAGILLRMRR